MMSDTTTARTDASAKNGCVAVSDDDLTTVCGGLTALQVWVAIWNAAMPVKIYLK